MSRHVMSAHQMDIRTATVEDARAIAELSERVFMRTFAADNKPSDVALYVTLSFGEEQQRREIEDPANQYLLVFVDAKLVAFALLCFGATDAVVTGPSPVEIRRFYVDDDFHGRGVAAHLMEACVAAAQAREARTLWLGTWERNARAIRFYVKAGFHDAGSHPFVLGEDVQTDRVMVRSLGAAGSPDPVHLAEAFARVSAHWTPVVVGTLNGQHVKVVKFQGEFTWHQHANEDEMFLVHRGAFDMQFRDRTVHLAAGDFLIVPRGVEHRPVATDEVEVVLFEPIETRRTGDASEAPRVVPDGDM